MDCRKFHKNFEDYLEGGLDFPGRFGMERHAQQCISCGKDLVSAQRMRNMVREIERVKAPSGFESTVLNEIGKRKAGGRFSGLRRFWLYNLEFPAVRTMALASSCFAVLGFGAFYVSAYLSRRAAQEVRPAAPIAAREPTRTIETQSIPAPAVAHSVRPPKPRPASVEEELTKPPDPEREQIAEQEAMETDYVELQVIGPDNRPVSLRLPNKARVRDGQTPDEYIFRNVSH